MSHGTPILFQSCSSQLFLQIVILTILLLCFVHFMIANYRYFTNHNGNISLLVWLSAKTIVCLLDIDLLISSSKISCITVVLGLDSEIIAL